jgi:hypothetical protein
VNDVQLFHAETLLAILHPQPTTQAMIEVTGLLAKSTPAKRYLGDVQTAARCAVAFNDLGYNSFVSVNPRSAPSGFEKDVPFVTALALDLQIERMSIETVWQQLTVAELLPTAVAWSGYGYHFYLSVNPTEPSHAKLIWERLCKWTGSDPIHATNRIMRVPGTLNLKRGGARWCHLMGINRERVYDIDHVNQRLDAVGAPAARTPKEGIPVPVDPPEDWLALRDRIREQPGGGGVIDIIDTGEKNAYSEKQVTRSEADWVVICALVRAGAPDEMVVWLYETQPVKNLKYYDAGPRYLYRTIEAARRATAAPIERSGRARYAHKVSTGSSREQRRY